MAQESPSSQEIGHPILKRVIIKRTFQMPDYHQSKASQREL